VSEEPRLRLVSISKSYGPVKALEDVSFEVLAGEVVGLVGDNGAGKSTAVKIVSGAIAPDGGEVFFDGKPRAWGSPRQAQLAGIETLYQDMGLAGDLSVDANIFLGREVRRPGPLGRFGFFDSSEMKKRSAQAFAELKVRVPAGDYPTSELSGGQRQAVAIAKSIMWAKQLLLLDEPTNHLGASGTHEVLDLIRRIRDTGISVVLISHTIPHVLSVADRIVVLWQGHVAAQIDAGDATIERVVAEITGSGAMG
jgi:simple sugar transport system ATP-binding protein